MPNHRMTYLQTIQKETSLGLRKRALKSCERVLGLNEMALVPHKRHPKLQEMTLHAWKCQRINWCFSPRIQKETNLGLRERALKLRERVLELNKMALVSHERDPKLQEMALEMPKNYLVLQSSYVQLKVFSLALGYL